ncbi:MAG: hypothetical protein Q9219_006033 [cf. Caloplaca sp. 3 TL-2023]
MANLMIDIQYQESYPECTSSSSTFSYGLPTPTSSTEYSAETSRRQSIASDIQSCTDSAFGRVSNFSTEGIITPLKTPPLLNSSFPSDKFSPITQGYDAEPSPTGIQHRRRFEMSSVSDIPHLHAPSVLQSACLGTPTPSGLDVNIQGATHQDEYTTMGSRPAYQSMMEWSGSFNDGFPQDWSQVDPTRFAEGLSLDTTSRLYLNCVQPGLLTTSDYLSLGMENATVMATESPQTVSPQETFVCPNPSLPPSTPTCRPLEAALQTPSVKSERRAPIQLADGIFSPCSSLADDEDPAMRISSVQKYEEPIMVQAHTLSKKPTRSGSRVKKKPSTRTCSPRYPFPHDVVDSSKKSFICGECGLKFERGEHLHRHEDANIHQRRLIESGRPGEFKQHRCQVPGCITAVSRADNLKPHYRNTHFYERFIVKNGKRVENKKRRPSSKWVSPEEAIRLGIGQYDYRTTGSKDELLEDMK